MGRAGRRHSQTVITLAILIWMVGPVYSQQPSTVSLADWEARRYPVTHPATVIKPADLARARENTARYAWARDYVESTRRRADAILLTITPEYLATQGGAHHARRHGALPRVSGQGPPLAPQWPVVVVGGPAGPAHLRGVRDRLPEP